MKSLVACLLAAIAFVPTAPAQRYESSAGGWHVSGEGGSCLASTQIGSFILMIVSPAVGGENEGGFAIASHGFTDLQKRSLPIALEGKGAWARQYDGDEEPEIHGYWLPFDKASELDGFPDAWHLRAIAAGKAVAEGEVTGFKTAAAELRVCVARTGKAG